MGKIIIIWKKENDTIINFKLARQFKDENERYSKKKKKKDKQTRKKKF